MPRNVVVIGAVALGPKAACRFKRLEPDSRVVMVDKDHLISYGGCGIPYFISGDVSDPGQLQETSFHMLRDKEFFQGAKDIEVLTNTEALSIDRQEKKVHIQKLTTGEDSTLPYDELVLATGSRPRRLDIPGIDLEGVFAVSNMNAAIAIKERIASGQVENALIIGGGFIGLEMAEALTDMWGIETTVVEITDQLLPGLVSKNMAKIVQHHMEEQGVAFQLEDRVERLEGNKKVERAITTGGIIAADMVIVAVGAEPNSDLARAAGLEVSPRGGIVVNSRMQTSDPDIYAGGDCVEVTNLITGKPGYYPLGSMANRQGRIIGDNLAGGNSEFPGAVGSFVVKVFELSVAAAGLSSDVARSEGFDAISALVIQFDRAHFYPDSKFMFIQLIADRSTRKILGVEAIGGQADAVKARVDAIAPLLHTGIDVDDVCVLETGYAPPFASAMDIINNAGNVLDNILEGRNSPLDMLDFIDLFHDQEIKVVDLRELSEAEPFIEQYGDRWINIPQAELRTRFEELPRSEDLYLLCGTGSRSYECQVFLNQQGYDRIKNIQGGYAVLAMTDPGFIPQD